MIEVTYQEGTYCYHKREEGASYWFGSGIKRGPLHPGSNCVAPRGLWTTLQRLAIENGVSPEEFKTPKKEEKPKRSSVKRSPAKKKSSGPTISIFSEV